MPRLSTSLNIRLPSLIVRFQSNRACSRVYDSREPLIICLSIISVKSSSLSLESKVISANNQANKFGLSLSKSLLKSSSFASIASYCNTL